MVIAVLTCLHLSCSISSKVPSFAYMLIETLMTCYHLQGLSSESAPR